MVMYSYKVLTLDRNEKWVSPALELVDSYTDAGKTVFSDPRNFAMYRWWFTSCNDLGFKLIPVNCAHPDQALTLDDIQFFTKYAIINPELRDLFIVG